MLIRASDPKNTSCVVSESNIVQESFHHGGYGPIFVAMPTAEDSIFPPSREPKHLITRLANATDFVRITLRHLDLHTRLRLFRVASAKLATRLI